MKKRIKHHLARLRASPLLGALGTKGLPWLRRVARWGAVAGLVLVVLLAATWFVAWTLLPGLAERKADVEEFLSQRSHQQVRIEELATFWDGLSPGLHAMGLEVSAPDGARPSIRLGEVRISLALLPLLRGEIGIKTLVVSHPTLAFERQADGRFRVAGFDPVGGVVEPGSEQFVPWLFRQNRLVIENGELQWVDQKDGGATLHLKQVNLSLDNRGDRHRLTASAAFPEGICAGCSLRADVRGNPLADDEWEAELFVRARGLNVERLPLIAREHLPRGFKGHFNAELYSDWTDGRPESVIGDLTVSKLSLPLPGFKAPLTVRQAGTALRWRREDEGWKLELSRLALGLSGPSWSAGRLRVSYQPERSTAELSHLKLGDVTGLIAGIARESTPAPAGEEGVLAPSRVVELWTALAPGGELDDIRVRLDGALPEPEDFVLDAKLGEIRIAAYERLPGFSGVSGSLRMRRDSGELTLNARDFTLSLPRIFRAPLTTDQASGRIRWSRQDDHWVVKGDDLEVSGPDGQGSGRLTLKLPRDPAQSPHLDLRVDFRNGNGANAEHYYPVQHLPPRVLDWMERSFLGGRITAGFLVYDGYVREFPFREGSGRFEIQGHVTNGAYRYLPGWAPVSAAEVDVAIRNEKVRVTGSGRIRGLDVTQVAVETELGKGHEVHVRGHVTGPINQALEVLRDVKPQGRRLAWQGLLRPKLEASGQGALDLNIVVPPGRGVPATFDGEYRVTDAGLVLPGIGVAATAIEGSVGFTDRGLRDGALRGQVLGGEVAVTMATSEGQRLRVDARGRTRVEPLASLLGERVASHIGGEAGWEAVWTTDKGIGRLKLETDLSAVKLTLPPPLERPDGLATTPLVVRTESATADRHVLAVSVGADVQGQLALVREPEGWRFRNGRIDIGGGRGSLPSEPGLHVSARVGRIDADAWLALTGGEGKDLPDLLARVSAETSSLLLFDRDFGRVSVDLSHQYRTWSGGVSGPAVLGTLRYARTDSGRRIDMELSQLSLPEKVRERRGDVADPRGLPMVNLRSREFRFKDRPLGELEFKAAPTALGWEISRLTLTRDAMHFTANGEWNIVTGRHTSSFEVQFTSSDLGATLAQWGMPDQIVGGTAEINSSFNWAASPADFRAALLNGRIDITSKKGQFVQVKQGAARLFGMLDLSAISRYLTLDLSPIFGKGFPYDQVSGRVTIELGNAYTHNLAIKGPSAHIGIDGRLGLAAEDIDLTMAIEPQLSTGLTLTSWGIWGPQVAAAVLAFQKLFKKQITEGTRAVYTVKGSWDDPKVVRLARVGTEDESFAPGNQQ